MRTSAVRTRGSAVRTLAFASALLVAISGCAGIRPGGHGPSHPRIDLSHAQPAAFVTHGSVNQVWLTGAQPHEQLRLVDGNDRLVTTATADANGSLIYREVERGRHYRVAGQRHGRHRGRCHDLDRSS